MKSNTVTTLLNLPESTLRKYANDFAEYLSKAADLGAGRHRDYSDHDVRVLKFVIEMKAARQSVENIHATLRAMQSNGWERLPALSSDASEIIPAPATLLANATERAVLVKEAEMLREQLDAMKSDAQRQAERINELERKLSRAETLIELYEDGRLKPPAKS